MNMILSSIFLLLSVVLTKLFCIVAKNTRLMDKPNERSLHFTPTVRGGGVVFIGLSLIAISILSFYDHSNRIEHVVLIMSILLLAGISFLDDLFHLSVKLRFIVQALVAIWVVLVLRPVDLDFVFFTLSNQYGVMLLLFIVLIWSINHFNFMDGLDGFCAMQALFMLTSYAILFELNQAQDFQTICYILISCLAGFLIFNFPPAKLFMGDIGSATLGLITILIALIAQQKYHIPIIYWFILNGLFLFDSTITLLRRMINHEKWLAPHRTHAYQRIRQLGVKTHIILLGQLIVNGLFLLWILLLQNGHLNLSAVLFFQLGTLLFIYCLIERVFPMFQEATWTSDAH